MTLARRKLEQRRSRALACPLALRTDKTTGEIMHKGCGRSPERRKVNVTLGLAARAFDFQPRIAAIDGLIDSGARIDGAAVAPHLLIPALTREVVGFPDQCLALTPFFLGALGENPRHGPRLGKLFLESFAVAAGQRHVVKLRSHGASERTGPVRAIVLDVGATAATVLQPVAIWRGDANRRSYFPAYLRNRTICH
jgi:hypothetical protein